MAQSRSGGSRSGGGRSKSKSSSSGKGKSTTAKASGSRSAPSRSAASRSASSRSGSTSRSASSRSGSTSRSASSRSATSRKAAASKGGKARARQQKARKAASATAKTAARGARAGGVEAKTVAELREALRKNLIRPMEMVMLSRERIEEVLGEAVDQGRVTARDAQRITSGLVKRGQRQTNDVLKDLEGLLRPAEARGRAVRRASPALAQVDRLRRTAGVGPSFPVTGYDDLTASQIHGRLGTLTPAELRKVRDHERRTANRKTVLQSIESKLS
jgi:polyhydroxyalkanoate synthesis regulator phasin